MKKFLVICLVFYGLYEGVSYLVMHPIQMVQWLVYLKNTTWQDWFLLFIGIAGVIISFVAFVEALKTHRKLKEENRILKQIADRNGWL